MLFSNNFHNFKNELWWIALMGDIKGRRNNKNFALLCGIM